MKNHTKTHLSWLLPSLGRPGLASLGLGVLTLLAPPQAPAASYYWDIDGANPGAGGANPAGIWSAGGTTWSTSVNGDVSILPYTTAGGDVAYFSAGTDATGDYTITLNGTQAVKYVSTEEGNVTLSGGTLGIASTTSSGGDYLNTVGSANLTFDSTCTLLVSNTLTGNNFFNFKPNSGTTITFNGPIKASVNNSANKILMRHSTGAGTVIFNTDLGSDPWFKASLSGGPDGSFGTMTFNGTQSLSGINFNNGSRSGTINFGGTLNTNIAVTIGNLSIGSGGNNLSGATYNVNSAMSCGTIGAYANGVVNVAGSIIASGATTLGSTTATHTTGTLNLLAGAAATLAAINVYGESTFNDAGILNGGVLTLAAAPRAARLFWAMAPPP